MNQAQIDQAFKYHKPNDTQQVRYVAIREKAKELAVLMKTACPDSREKSLAFIWLQNTVMWANASIAINESTE